MILNAANGAMENEWKRLSSFTPIGGLANHVVQQELRDCEATTLADALEVVKRASCSLNEALSPHFNVTLKEKSNE